VVRYAAVALLAFSCSDTASTPDGTVEVLVAASDYTSSKVCGAPGGCRDGADLGKDPQLAESNGRVFFLARDFDLLFELDAKDATPIGRFSVHVDDARVANPHDVAAAADGSLFVALYNLPKIAVVKDGKVDGTIDLSPYDSDGNPQAESIRIVGGKAFVTLERLDDKDLLKSKQPSQMLRIDVATRAVEAVLPLAGRNPFNMMSESDGALFMAEPGNFDAAHEDAAGIERFDTATSTSRMVVAEHDVDGSVSEVAVRSGCGVAIVAGPQPTVNPTSVVTFDPTTGVVSKPVLGPTPGYDLQGLAWRGDTLYVGDRKNLLIHVLEREGASCTLRDTGRTIALAQRPVALRAAK